MIPNLQAHCSSTHRSRALDNHVLSLPATPRLRGPLCGRTLGAGPLHYAGKVRARARAAGCRSQIGNNRVRGGVETGPAIVHPGNRLTLIVPPSVDLGRSSYLEIRNAPGASLLQI